MIEQTAISGVIAKRQEAKAERELAIYNDYKAAQAAGAYATDINHYIMERYHIRSISTVYAIKKRVEEKLNQKSHEN